MISFLWVWFGFPIIAFIAYMVGEHRGYERCRKDSVYRMKQYGRP